MTTRKIPTYVHVVDGPLDTEGAIQFYRQHFCERFAQRLDEVGKLDADRRGALLGRLRVEFDEFFEFVNGRLLPGEYECRNRLYALAESTEFVTPEETPEEKVRRAYMDGARTAKVLKPYVVRACVGRGFDAQEMINVMERATGGAVAVSRNRWYKLKGDEKGIPERGI